MLAGSRPVGETSDVTESGISARESRNLTRCVTLSWASQFSVQGVPFREIAAIIGAGKSGEDVPIVGTQPALIHPQGWTRSAASFLIGPVTP